MRNFLTTLIAMTLLACTYPASASTIKVDTNRLILVNEPIGKNVAKQIDKMKEMTAKSKKPIYLYLDSPGGSVTAGLFFIHNMEKAQAQGVKFVCVVDELAASMAFQFLAHCDERYAHKTSAMLWHPVRVNIFAASITPIVARNLFLDLNYIEKALLPKLLKELKIEKTTFFRHYHAETLHYGLQLHRLTPSFLSLIHGIKNQTAVDKAIEDKKKKKKKPSFSFFGEIPPIPSDTELQDLKDYEIDYTFRGAL